MPLSFRNMYTIITRFRTEKITFGLRSKVIIKDYKHFTPKQHICLSRVGMPMYRQYSARQKHIYETLCFCIQTFMKIEIHA